jgi:hypothetical protein
VETRLRPPGRLRGLAGKQSRLERLLHRTKDLRFRQSPRNRAGTRLRSVALHRHRGRCQPTRVALEMSWPNVSALVYVAARAPDAGEVYTTTSKWDATRMPYLSSCSSYKSSMIFHRRTVALQLVLRIWENHRRRTIFTIDCGA